MTVDERLQQWVEFTEETVEALLADGSNPDAVYSIEHHFASEDFDALEKAALAAFRKGFDVGEPEEFQTEDGERVFSFDIVFEHPLDEDMIIEDIERMLALADETNVEYDGWGTFFEE